MNFRIIWIFKKTLNWRSIYHKFYWIFYVGKYSNFIVSRFRYIIKETQRKKKIHVSFKTNNLSLEIHSSFHHGSSDLQKPPKTTDFLKLLPTYFCLLYSSPLLQFNDIKFWPCGQWHWTEQKWSLHVLKE